MPFLDWVPLQLMGTNGIILLADTRYSWPGGRRRFDRGAKIIRLGTHAGCVCAGGVDEVRRAAAVVKPFFEQNPTPDAAMANEFLVAALTAFNQRTYARASAELYSLSIGYVAADARLQLFGWGPSGALDHHPDWGFVVGQHQYTPAYESVLQQRCTDARARGSVGLTPDSALLEYAIGLYDLFVELDLEPSVGGALQAAMITSTDGFEPRQIYFGVSTEQGDPPLAFFQKTPDVTFDWTSKDMELPRHKRAVFAVSLRPVKR